MYPNDLWLASPTENYLYRIDEGTHNITKVSITGTEPRGLYVSQDKISVYVTNKSSNSLSIFRSGIMVNDIEVGKQPWAVCEDIDGNIYVANYMSNTVTKIDGTTGYILATISVDNGPRGIVSDGNGDIYVSCFLTNTVCKIVNDKLVASIEVGMNPEGITCDYYNNIWVACYGSNIVSKIYRNKKILDIAVGAGPISVVCNKDGIVYVANYLGNTITVIEKQQGINDDTNISYTDIITTNITVEDGPNSLSVDYNDNIYVTNSISNTISIINGKTLLKTFDSICNNPTAYGDGTGGIIYNITRVRTPCEGGGDDSPITYDDLDQYLKDILDKVINNQVESSSENVSYDNSEYPQSTNVKLALNELYEKAKNLSGINSDLIYQIQNLQSSDSFLQEKIEQILQQIESLTTKDTELEGRVRVLETQSGTIDPEISEKITKLEGYFSEEGKANSSLDSDKLGGKDPSYYVNDDELEELKTKDTELENRISSLEEFGTEVDPEISEKITKLEGYFSEDGKANSSLDSDKLGGKDPSYYASTEQLSSVINGITWKNPVLNITKLKEINSPQEGWTVSIEDTNKIYRFDTSTEIESDSDDETKIKANDGTTGSWLLLGTVVYNKATQEQDGLMSKEDKTTVDNLGSTYLSLAGGEVTGEITANKIYANNNILVFNNVEEMKASNKIKQGYTVQTLGFYEAGDGGGATYYSLPEDDDSEVDGYSIIEVQEVIGGAKVGIDKVGNSKTTSYKSFKLKLLISNLVNIKWFGAKIDGVTDDSDAFNRTNQFLVNNSNRFDFNYNTNIASGTIYIPKGTMKINSSINIDAGCMGVQFDGTIIDATEITSDYAIRLYSSTWSHLSATAMHNLFGLILRGDKTNNKVAILYDGVPQFNLVKTSISGFGKSIEFKNNCYIYNFYDCGFDRCSDVCIENPSNLSNSGERINFIGCTFSNSSLAIRNSNPNGAIHLLNCSIDYNIKAFEISNSSIIFCTDCHFEWSRYDNPHFTLSDESSMLKINGGYIVSRPEVDYDQIPELNCIFDNINCGSTGGVILTNTHIHHMISNYLFSGANYQIENSKTYTPFTLPPLCEEDIDYSKFSDCLDSFIKNGNDSTSISIEDKNIIIKRVNYTNECIFHFFKKLDPKSSGFGNLVLEFSANSTVGGAINVSLNTAYEKNDGTIIPMTQLDFYDIKNLLTEAGADNLVKHYHTWYVDNNLLLFGKNYNKNIYIYVNITLWGLDSNTKFKFNKINFDQY